MTAVDIHSASPINSDCAKEDTVMNPEKMIVENGAVNSTTDPMTMSEDIVQDESASNQSGAMEIDSERDHESLEQDTLMEEILMAVAPKTEAPTVENTQAIQAAQPVQAPIATDWYAYYSTANKARKSVTKAHTRNPSISATMELPWAVDNTSSSPQKSHNRAPSISIPPPPKAVDMVSNGNSSYEHPPTNTESPKLHPLMTKVPPSSPAPYTHSSIRQAPSPYSSTSSSDSRSQSQQPGHSLTNPPGYTQNTHFSFSTIQTDTTNTSASHPSTPTTSYSHTHSISLSRPSSSHSTSYSPTDKSAPPIPLYNTNTSPFYSNNAYSGADYGHGYGYSNSLFSPTFSFTTPSTATPKTPASASRRGILDNDPSIYLRPDGENADDDGSIWDTATKWAKMASNKLSLNGNGSAGDRHSSSMRGGGMGSQSEFSVSSGLWRMVGRLDG